MSRLLKLGPGRISGASLTLEVCVAVIESVDTIIAKYSLAIREHG